MSPFDGPNGATEFLEKIGKIQNGVKDVSTREPGNKPVSEDLSPLSVDAYSSSRVDDQIGFYHKRASEYQAKADRFGNVVVVLGAASVALGLLSVVKAVSGWIAVIATVAAALSAHVQNQRYQQLTVMYQATGRRLEILKAEWAASHKTDADKAERDLFIQRCEETLALENGAWVAQLSQKEPDKG